MEFSDLLAYAQAVYSYNQTHSEKITFLSTQYNTAVTTLLSQLVQSEYGKTIFSSRKESLEVMKTVYQKLEQLAQYKPIEQYTTYGNLTYDAQQRILKQDKYLFITQPSWMYLLWNNSNPEGSKMMKPCEIPSMDGKTSPTYSGFYQIIFVVPKASPNVEAAKRFIRYIASEQIAETWIKYAKCPTALKTKISYSDFGQEEFELYYRHLQKKYGNNQKDVNISKLLFNTSEPLNFNAENILNGTMKASDALRNLEKQLR
jgi:ABC-type glycerol-3-phosphate transport system substrate-binding protein